MTRDWVRCCRSAFMRSQMYVTMTWPATAAAGQDCHQAWHKADQLRLQLPGLLHQHPQGHHGRLLHAGVPFRIHLAGPAPFQFIVRDYALHRACV